MSRREPGRLRIAAAEILSEGLGFYVHPADIIPVRGAWKSDDVWRWELNVLKDQQGRPFHCGCWETLTEFVRRARKEGFHVGKGGDEIWSGSGDEVLPVPF